MKTELKDLPSLAAAYRIVMWVYGFTLGVAVGTVMFFSWVVHNELFRNLFLGAVVVLSYSFGLYKGRARGIGETVSIITDKLQEHVDEHGYALVADQDENGEDRLRD